MGYVFMGHIFVGYVRIIMVVEIRIIRPRIRMRPITIYRSILMRIIAVACIDMPRPIAMRICAATVKMAWCCPGPVGMVVMRNIPMSHVFMSHIRMRVIIMR